MLTRRGRLLIVVIVASLLMAWRFGARSLNAIVVPSLVALLAAWIQLRRLDRPTVQRTQPRYGFVGEEVALEVHFDAPTPFTAVVSEAVGEGLSIPDDEVETTLAETTITYPLELTGRGEHEVGPTTVVARDVLGLLERSFRFPAREEILVFPRVHDLDGELVEGLRGLTQGTAAKDRHEFDRLRQYEHGDTLRDVHWKASAKRDNLIVKEFETVQERREVEIATTADGDRVDAMAEAAASIATYLLDCGLAVGMSTPSGRISPGRVDDRSPGSGSRDDQRTQILTLLARTAAGGVPTERRDDADVVVHAAADAADVTITIDGRQFSFDQLSRGSATGDAAASPVAGRADRAGGAVRTSEVAAAGEADGTVTGATDGGEKR